MKNRVLIVDDVLENRKLLASILRDFTDYEIITAKSGMDIINRFESIKKNPPDLILLDVIMPKINGFDVAAIFKESPLTRDIPIIFITALTNTENKVKAFEAGGVDYISKPFNKQELLARVNTHIRIKNLHDELKMKNKLLLHNEAHLRYLVEQKTKKIDNMTISMVSALENANYYNDEVTGNHVKRVSAYSAIIAMECGCYNDFVKRIKIYAPLHDVGKVGIPDEVLKKPGIYSTEEFEIMKQHVIIGGNMLDSPDIDIMARNIALYHHERWDGSGYMAGLKGENIPLEARIISIVDVYDALVTQRSYKKALSDEEADQIIRENAAKHFDPALVETFLKVKERIIEIRNYL